MKQKGGTDARKEKAESAPGLGDCPLGNKEDSRGMAELNGEGRELGRNRGYREHLIWFMSERKCA